MPWPPFLPLAKGVKRSGRPVHENGICSKRTAHEAVNRVAEAIVKNKTRVLDLDLRAYFDNVRHHLLLAKVARRVNDEHVMHLLKTILKASGKKGVPQGGPLAPLLSNVYLNEVDRMLERAKEVTRRGPYTYIEYVRFADDLVVLVDAYARHDWLLKAVEKRLREELVKLQVEVNDEKTRTVNLAKGECFGFLGFEFRRVRSLKGSMAGAVHAAAIETCIANATRASHFQAIFQGFRRAGRCIAFTGINKEGGRPCCASSKTRSDASSRNPWSGWWN